MRIYKITYKQYDTELEQIIVAEAYPGDKRVLKYLNMYAYCGHEMSDEDYKEFVIDMDHYTHYDIIDIDELKFITIPEKKSQSKK